jgi:SAM-dependent methyltransferase
VPGLRRTCPACSRTGREFRSADRIAADLTLTKTTYDERAHHEDLPPLKLMQDDAVAVFGCDTCGSLWRAEERLWCESVERYESDGYPASVLDRSHEIDRDDAAARPGWLERVGVRPGAHVLEVACYSGGFLAVLQAAGACASGLDPNPQMVEYCRSRGLRADVGTIDDADPPEPLDVLFALNCFDQLPDPHAFCARAAVLVRPGGQFVIRTPNATYVRRVYEGSATGDRRAQARAHLVWGVPFLACYSPCALDGLLRRHGFALEQVTARPGNEVGVATPIHDAPWLDLVGRRVDRDEARSASHASRVGTTEARRHAPRVYTL